MQDIIYLKDKSSIVINKVELLLGYEWDIIEDTFNITNIDDPITETWIYIDAPYCMTSERNNQLTKFMEANKDIDQLQAYYKDDLFISTQDKPGVNYISQKHDN